VGFFIYIIIQYIFSWINHSFSCDLLHLQIKINPMNRIKEVMDEKGIKQTWLSEKLGKSYSQVNGYVQNRHQPRLEVLFEIAKLLEVSPKELIVDNSK
jgi:ribosome-binding protein aMBF1 (putative translation factor)